MSLSLRSSPAVDYKYNYRPIPPAEKIHTSTADINLLVCGARSGKTRAVLGGQLPYDAILQPGYFRRDINDGENYGMLVCEPTFKMVKLIAWKLVLNAIPPHLIIDKNETDRIVWVRGVYGVSQIVFASYEQGSEKIEGISLYRSYLDECFQCPEPFYDEVLTRLGDRRGKLYMVGTPKPVSYIMERIIDKAPTSPDINMYHWKTVDNPYFPKDRLEKLKSLLPPKIFKRNFEASLDSFSGQVYETFDRNIHLKVWDIQKEDYKIIWGSHDWGWTHNGSMYIYGLRDDDCVDILHEVSEPGINLVRAGEMTEDTWFDYMKKYQDMYDDLFDYFFAGVDRPENIDTLSGLGIRITGADNAVDEGIQFVMALMKPDKNGHSKLRIHAENCPKLAKKIPMLRFKENSDGTMSEQQLKRDDDECDSMRYGLFSMRQWFKIWNYLTGKEDV